MFFGLFAPTSLLLSPRQKQHTDVVVVIIIHFILDVMMLMTIPAIANNPTMMSGIGRVINIVHNTSLRIFPFSFIFISTLSFFVGLFVGYHLSTPLGAVPLSRCWYTVSMLYVFCGDRFGVRELSREFVAACQKKRAGAEYIYLSPSVEHYSLEELLLGQGLFEQKYVVFCDEMLGDTSGQHLADNLPLYVESPHMFVVFEPSLDTRSEKKLSGAGAVIKRCREQKADSEDVRPVFAFVDVFLRGDRQKSFAALHSLLRSGGPPSSVLNMLLWQLRMLVLVSQSGSASAAGVKPFVYTKAKKSACYY